VLRVAVALAGTSTTGPDRAPSAAQVVSGWHALLEGEERLDAPGSWPDRYALARSQLLLVDDAEPAAMLIALGVRARLGTADVDRDTAHQVGRAAQVIAAWSRNGMSSRNAVALVDAHDLLIAGGDLMAARDVAQLLDQATVCDTESDLSDPADVVATVRHMLVTHARTRARDLLLLPSPAEEIVRGLDAVVVTHRHRDHLDARAEELLPRDVPVFCQPEDENALRELGLDARAIVDQLDWDGMTITRTPARHGSGRVAELLAPVSGFVLDDFYLAGDTVWYEEVEETIERHRPRVAVVNAGGAELVEGGLTVMGADDVREVVARVPTVIAVHMEALNHCFLEREALRRAVPGVLIPADGEMLEL
jgi:L-ascorbate metabolism protein UlaG (beta-lactamase superfamily)